MIDGIHGGAGPGRQRTLMIGVDCETGDVVWQTPNPKGWKMSHSSIIPMTLLGKKTYVYCAIGGVIGVSAEEEDRGDAALGNQRLDRTRSTSPSPVPDRRAAGSSSPSDTAAAV